MSLLKTKPTYTEVVATNRGWEDAKTGELLVAIKNLKDNLAKETGEIDTFKKPIKKSKKNG
jgi:hypothetical protein